MIVDFNFLPKDVFTALQDYCQNNEFQIVEVGGKKFSVLPVPDFVLGFFQIPDHDLILSFIRSAKSDFDTKPSIHADYIVAGRKTALASVLYINSSLETTKNGTAFWTHEKYGEELKENISNEEFDRMLIEDANDLSKWQLKKIVWSEPNKRILYNSNFFHSKYPRVIKNGTRVVLVCFYAKR
jgi:hypothetical protein